MPPRYDSQPCSGFTLYDDDEDAYDIERTTILVTYPNGLMDSIEYTWAMGEKSHWFSLGSNVLRVSLELRLRGLLATKASEPWSHANEIGDPDYLTGIQVHYKRIDTDPSPVTYGVLVEMTCMGYVHGDPPTAAHEPHTYKAYADLR